MGILTRHIALETVKTLAVALLSLTVLLSISMAAKEAVRLGMPPLLVVQALPFFMIEMIGYALPASVLYVICSTFGRMACDNEIVAIKALGVNPLRVVFPALAGAFLLSLLTVVTYDLTAVWGRPGIRTLMAESAADVAEGVLATQKAIDLSWGSVSVRSVEDGKLVKPTVRLRGRHGAAETLLDAREGDLESDATGVTLVLLDAEASVGAQTAVFHPGRFEIEFPISDTGRPVHRDWLAQSEIPGQLADLKEQLHLAVNFNIAPTFQSTIGPEDEIERLKWKIRRIEAEPYRRWANGFSCLSFALLGVPIALRLRTADAISTFFAAFLPVLVVYYPLLMASEKMALGGAVGPAVYWLGDAVLATVGLALLWRVSRR